MNIQTNATDTKTVSVLSELTTLDQGTLFSACIHKMGKERGRGKKLVYGDDTVHVLIWTGFNYQALIARSHKVLNQQLAKGGYIERLARATLALEPTATIEDVCYALQETRDGFRKVLADGTDPDRAARAGMSSSVWEPLVINGVKVKGSRVYTGPAHPEDPRAPVPGTVYVQGVKLGENLVTPAEHGDWQVDSKPKTVAKQIIKEQLPVGLYCQYRLSPERVTEMSVAGDAVKVAKAKHIGIDPQAVLSLFKIAP